jgi:hypothetical protein
VVSRRRGFRGALLLAVLLCLLVPASAMAADTEITGGPAEGETINDSTPTFTFTSPDPFLGFECSVDGGPFAACGTLLDSSHTTGELGDGAHTFAVRAVDLLGPDDTPATRSFTVDTTGPVATIDSGPNGPTSDPTPRFDFSSSEPGSTFECNVDGGGFGPCEGPGDSHIVDPPLADGPHTFAVRAIDQFDNVGAPTPPRGFTVDTASPNTAIDSGPNGTTGDDTPTFGFSSNEPGSTFQCRVDGGAFGPCSGPGDSHTIAPLADGPHSFEVRAVDAAGNRDTDPPIRVFTVDTAPPNTAIDSGPVGTVSDDTPTFTFSSAGGDSFECRLDSDPFAPCSDPGSHTTAPLADGEHTFAVRAVDAVGNRDPTPATRSFTVDTSLPPDTTAPETTITKRPKGKIKTKKKNAKVRVSFRSEPGAAFTCRLGKGKYEPCTSPYVVKAKSKGGKGKKHRISIRASDSAGNVGDPVVVGFRVQRAPRLAAGRAERTVVAALRRHGFARRVWKSVRTDCNRRGRAAFGCRFSSRFPGYRLRGKGEVKLRARLSYRFRVKAQGVRFTLTDKNEKARSR